MKPRGNYIFTNKTHPLKGVMSIILGLIAILSIAHVVNLVFMLRQEALVSYAMTVILALIYAIAGMTLAIITSIQRDIFKVTAYIGILLNAFVIIVVGIIIYLGVF